MFMSCATTFPKYSLFHEMNLFGSQKVSLYPIVTESFLFNIHCISNLLLCYLLKSQHFMHSAQCSHSDHFMLIFHKSSVLYIQAILFSAFLVLTYFNHSMHSFCLVSFIFMHFCAVDSHLCSGEWDIHWIYAPNSETFIDSMLQTMRHSLTLCSGQWDIDRLYAPDKKALTPCIGQWDIQGLVQLWMREIFHDVRILKYSKIASFTEQLRHWLRMRCWVDNLLYWVHMLRR